MSEDQNNPDLPATPIVRLINRDGTFNLAQRRNGRLNYADFYHSILLLPWLNFIALVFTLYLLVNAAFATAFASLSPGSLDGVNDGTFIERFQHAFFFSVQTLATIGYGKISPISATANVLVTLEALCGLLGFAIVTGLLFSRFFSSFGSCRFQQYRNDQYSRRDSLLSISTR